MNTFCTFTNRALLIFSCKAPLLLRGLNSLCRRTLRGLSCFSGASFSNSSYISHSLTVMNATPLLIDPFVSLSVRLTKFLSLCVSMFFMRRRKMLLLNFIRKRGWSMPFGSKKIDREHRCSLPLILKVIG